MPLLPVGIAALASGCSAELGVLQRALRGPGFFSCEDPALDAGGSLVREAYAASRLLHARLGAEANDAQSLVDPAGGGRTGHPGEAQAQRQCLTVAGGRLWPGCEADPGALAAICALDSRLA